jgi:hypothetical protein
MSPMGRPEGESAPKRVSAEGSPVSAAGPSQGANCAPSGGSEAAHAASVGEHP